MEVVQPDQQFVDLVRERLDEDLAQIGIPFNGIYPGMDDAGPVTSVLYEGSAPEFVNRFPELTQHWAPDWNQPAACVDLWIGLSHTDNTIEVTLEGLQLTELAQRYGDTGLIRVCERARAGNGELADRADAITHVLMIALRAAATDI
jgi:hypothetical protein